MRWTVMAAGLLAAATAYTAERVLGPEYPDIAPVMRPAPPDVFVAGPQTTMPRARDNALPRTRWEHRRNGDLWTRVAMRSAKAHGLVNVVPQDIDEWCPAYSEQSQMARAAFWAGLISTLARYESTWNERAIGGGGRWHGLMQIQPSTAAFRGCRAQTARALRVGPDNVSCAARIMGVTVQRDKAISVKGSRRWQGVAADWGPIRNDRMRGVMQRYTKRQVYCRKLEDVRPPARP